MSYDRYISLIPKDKRTARMPRTPNKRRKYSRRQWDGLVKKWKQDLHVVVAGFEDAEANSSRDEVTGADGDEVEQALGDEEDFMSTGRQSSTGWSWAEDVEREEAESEEVCKSRVSSSSSDQVNVKED